MSDDYELAVVGGGLAGLSAGLASARLGRRVMILTGGVPGGQLVSIEKVEGVPGFPDGVPGFDLCPMTQEQAETAGAEFSMTACDSIRPEGERWRLESADGDILARSVILATGAELASLGVAGEKSLAGKGVSHCASCDAPLLRGKVAIVAGGGDSAMQEALTLAEHASKVVMIVRGDEFSGQATFRDRVRAQPRIEPRFGAVITEILGDDGVTGVRLESTATGETTDIAAEGVFVYVGLSPNTSLARDFVAFDATGRIRVDAAMRTKARGLCAAGNVRAGSPHRAAGAMGDGAAAAVAIEQYLASGTWRETE